MGNSIDISCCEFKKESDSSNTTILIAMEKDYIEKINKLKNTSIC